MSLDKALLKFMDTLHLQSLLTLETHTGNHRQISKDNFAEETWKYRATRNQTLEVQLLSYMERQACLLGWCNTNPKQSNTRHSLLVSMPPGAKQPTHSKAQLVCKPKHKVGNINYRPNSSLTDPGNPNANPPP